MRGPEHPTSRARRTPSHLSRFHPIPGQHPGVASRTHPAQPSSPGHRVKRGGSDRGIDARRSRSDTALSPAPTPRTRFRRPAPSLPDAPHSLSPMPPTRFRCPALDAGPRAPNHAREAHTLAPQPFPPDPPDCTQASHHETAALDDRALAPASSAGDRKDGLMSSKAPDAPHSPAPGLNRGCGAQTSASTATHPPATPPTQNIHTI